MNSIKDIFGKMKAPQSWKEKLYKSVGEEKGAPVKRPVLKMKKAAAFAAGIAAVMAVSVTAAAAAGLFDLGAALKSNLGDGVSAAKLETGDYQPLDISAENDIMSLKAKAFMGDAADSYIIVEARLGEDVSKDFTRFGLNAIMYDETTSSEDVKGQYSDCHYAVPCTDENGETVYLFKMHTVPFYIKNALENGLALTVGIKGAVFEKDSPSWRTIKPMDLTFSFKPDKSVIKETSEKIIGSAVRMGGSSCIINRAIFSEYSTRLILTYNTDGTGETWNSYCRKLLNITGYSSRDYDYVSNDFDPESCPVKLIVDGKYVPMVSNNANSESSVYYSRGWNEPLLVMFSMERKGECMLALSYEPVDIEAAESVTLEIENSSGTEYVTVK